MQFDARSFRYQSFPGDPGMVDSLQKLAALKLPVLRDRSFLDVGCNEGYYCNIARHSGARRVVGLDANEWAISQARRRFPEIEFVMQSWASLPAERFDVILFASCLHYLRSLDEVNELFQRFHRSLSPDGVLVVETGLSENEEVGIEKVGRSDGGVVHYPTRAAVIAAACAANLVHREVGDSISADGRTRRVFHLRRRRDSVLVVRGTPGSGKSNFVTDMVGVEHVNLDSTLMDLGSEIPQLQELFERNLELSASVLREVAHMSPAYLSTRFSRRVLDELNAIQGRSVKVVEGALPDFLEVALERALESAGYRIWVAGPAHGAIHTGHPGRGEFDDGFLRWELGEVIGGSHVLESHQSADCFSISLANPTSSVTPRRVVVSFWVAVGVEKEGVMKLVTDDVEVCNEGGQWVARFDLERQASGLPLEELEIASLGVVDQEFRFRPVVV